MKIFFLCAFSFLNFNNSAHSNETREFDANTIKKLEISNPKGEISVISSSSAKKIIVTLEKIKFDKKCQFNLSSSTEMISAKIELENALFQKSNCITKLKIEIPKKKIVDVDVSSGSANIKLIDIDGNIDFSTATGSVQISGDILKNIEGKTATSNMNISNHKCPSRADINLVSATGDTVIVLPANCRIKVTHKSATGELFNELGESEDYQVHISAKSAAGNLKIKKIIK